MCCLRAIQALQRHKAHAKGALWLSKAMKALYNNASALANSPSCACAPHMCWCPECAVWSSPFAVSRSRTALRADMHWAAQREPTIPRRPPSIDLKPSRSEGGPQGGLPGQAAPLAAPPGNGPAPPAAEVLTIPFQGIYIMAFALV